MEDIVNVMVQKQRYEKRTASGFVDDEVWVGISAMIDRAKPTLEVTVGDCTEYKRFDTVDELDEQFDELVEKYGLET